MAVSAQHFESMVGPVLHDESVTQTEFARRVGCTQPNISKLIKAGKIFKNEKGRLNFYEALRAYEDNTDPAHHERLGKTSIAPGGKQAESKKPDLKDINHGDRFKQARAKREENTADLSELKLAKEAGLLCDSAKQRQDAFNVARGLRDSLFNIPERLAPILAAEQDERKIASILEEEITKSLNGLAASIEKMKSDVSG